MHMPTTLYVYVWMSFTLLAPHALKVKLDKLKVIRMTACYNVSEVRTNDRTR